MTFAYKKTRATSTNALSLEKKSPLSIPDLLIFQQPLVQNSYFHLCYFEKEKLDMSIQTLSYVAQFAKLEPWHYAIFSDVKKDLRKEHLKHDKAFFRTYFGSKVLLRLTVEDLLEVYPAVIAKGHEQLAEFVVNRWLLKHLDIYTFFETHLKKINPQIEQITAIDQSLTNDLIAQAFSQFGAVNTYIFCIFNSVSFSPETFEYLRTCAHNETATAGACTTT